MIYHQYLIIVNNQVEKKSKIFSFWFLKKINFYLLDVVTSDASDLEHRVRVYREQLKAKKAELDRLKQRKNKEILRRQEDELKKQIEVIKKNTPSVFLTLKYQQYIFFFLVIWSWNSNITFTTNYSTRTNSTCTINKYY